MTHATHDLITERQGRILNLIECGADTEEIADELGMNPWTCRDQIRRLRMKLGAASMRELPDAARAKGIPIAVCDHEAA